MIIQQKNNSLLTKKPLYYTVIVMGPAYGAQSAYCAYQFCKTLANTHNHKLISIFFYSDGIFNANSFTDPANDEFDLVKSWQKFAKEFHIDLNVCIAAAQRRGIINNKEKNNFSKQFHLVGLSELSKSMKQSDRVIQF